MSMQQQADTAIIGMGKSGISMAHYLMRQGETFDVFDEAVVDLSKENIDAAHVFSGPLTKDSLLQYHRVLLSPGIPWLHPALCAARAANIEMVGDLELFAHECACPFFAVTGTNGKTTATTLMTQLLSQLPGSCVSAGNIGTPMLDVLNPDSVPARVVLELSSFQLERSSDVHPQWAVLLNIQPDHADMHPSAAAYRDAKLSLFAQQEGGDTAMLPMDAEWNELSQQLYQRGVHVHRFGFSHAKDLLAETLSAGVLEKGRSQRLFWHQDGTMEMINCRHLPVRGLHQQMNLAVAAQAAADSGLSADIIRDVLIRFQGLAHRLQNVGETAGKQWFDDSKASNPTAAIAALQSFEQVTWICGGLRKGLDLSPLIPSVRQHVAVALVIGKETDAYIKMLEASGVPYKVAGNIERAVAMAADVRGGNPVLLSPAAASQDQFVNYVERGRAFVNAMANLSSIMPSHVADGDEH